MQWFHEHPIAAELMQFGAEIKDAKFKSVVLCGMGGSSLASLVFARTFEQDQNGLPLTVLDTTDPTTICEVARDLSNGMDAMHLCGLTPQTALSYRPRA